MKIRPTLMVATEMAHLAAITAAHKAMRNGDLVTAERWMKLSERYYRTSAYAQAEREKRAKAQRDRRRGG